MNVVLYDSIAASEYIMNIQYHDEQLHVTRPELELTTIFYVSDQEHSFFETWFDFLNCPKCKAGTMFVQVPEKNEGGTLHIDNRTPFRLIAATYICNTHLKAYKEMDQEAI